MGRREGDHSRNRKDGAARFYNAGTMGPGDAWRLLNRAANLKRLTALGKQQTQRVELLCLAEWSAQPKADFLQQT